MRRQCTLLGLNRSGLYYSPAAPAAEDLVLMKRIDAIYTDHPFFGVVTMTDQLRGEGYPVGPKRVRRLMRKMGLEALVPKPSTSKPHPEHRIWPYLLRDVEIVRANQVWSTDITFVPSRSGFWYLVAVLDWYSRYVLSWEVSETMETSFCISALRAALEHSTPQVKPEIFNSDQGSQFTSNDFTGVLLEHEIAISMDGRGRCFDNIFIERLWRTVKYEDIYLKDYQSLWELQCGLSEYFTFYNTQRRHSALAKRTPAEVYFNELDPP
jgi:putative transposase